MQGNDTHTDALIPPSFILDKRGPRVNGNRFKAEYNAPFNTIDAVNFRPHPPHNRLNQADEKKRENQHPMYTVPPVAPVVKTKRDRMFELEISNQSHSILLLRNELNNKDIEIVELKGQLQDVRIKMERLLKEKDKQIREKNSSNASLREELEVKMQMISTLQKEVGIYEARQQHSIHPGHPELSDQLVAKRVKEKDQELFRLQQDKDTTIAKKNLELHSLHQKLADNERQYHEQIQAASRKLAQHAEVHSEKQSRNTEMESTLRHAKSRVTTLEAELAVAKAESNNSKSLLVESEKAVALLRDRTKTLDSQLRDMEGIAHEVHRLQDAQMELSQAHAEKVKLRTLLEQKTAMVNKKDSEIASLQEQVDIYQEDYRVKSDLVESLEIRMKQRESEIESLKGEAAAHKNSRTDTQAAMKKLEGLIAEKDKEVAKLALLLQSANSDALSHKARADATATARDDLYAASTENTRVNILLQQANVDLALQRQTIESLEQKIVQLSARPTVMTNHMEELEHLVDQQSNTLAGLHDALAQRDTLIAFFEAEIGTKDKALNEYHDELSVRATRVTELEEALKKATVGNPKAPTKNVAHLEAQLRDLEAEQVRYRAEIKAARLRVEQLEAAQRQSGSHRRGNAADNTYQEGDLKDEAAAVAAELTSLRVLVRQAGRDSSAFSSLRESEIGGRDFPPGDLSLQSSIATIKRETDALRAAVTSFYAESVGSDCAVQ